MAQSLILLLKQSNGLFVFIAVWNYGSYMEPAAVRINYSHCRKGNLIHAEISTDLVLFYDEIILSVLPEICAYMNEHMNKCNKIRIMFLCVVNLTTSIFHSTQHQTLVWRNKEWITWNLKVDFVCLCVSMRERACMCRSQAISTKTQIWTTHCTQQYCVNTFHFLLFSRRF
jgi:hypothetical protein